VIQAQERLNRALEMRKRRVERAPQRKADHRAEQLASGRREGRELPTTITALRGDTAHLSERMGLFILIVLGEGIVQLIGAADASEHWNRALLVAAAGAFALVCELFFIAVVRGTAGLALLPADAIPPRALWIGHLVVAMSLVTLMAALGKLLEEPYEPVSAHTAWMLGIGIGGFGLASGAAHLLSGTARRWVTASLIAAPMVLVGLWIRLATESLSASSLGWLLAASAVLAGVLGTWSLGGLRSRTKGAPQS
jgi:low temperature requirement protein LtrA